MPPRRRLYGRNSRVDFNSKNGQVWTDRADVRRINGIPVSKVMAAGTTRMDVAGTLVGRNGLKRLIAPQRVERWVEPRC